MISRTLIVYVGDADSVGGAITATITSYLMTRDIQQLEEYEAESSSPQDGLDPWKST